MTCDIQLEDVYYGNDHKPIQYKVELGIMVNLLQFIIEKETHAPEHKASILKACKFLKLFDFLTYRKKHLEWYNRQSIEKLDFVLDHTCTYETIKILKNDLKAQFKKSKKISMGFEDEFINLIEWYCDKYDVSFSYAIVLFYQCGRALKISVNSDFYYYGGMGREPKKCNHKETTDDKCKGFEAIKNYELSYDKENVYLHTPDNNKIKCPFERLELYL